MKEKNVIDRKNLPTRFPLTFIMVSCFLLDYYNADPYIIGAFGLFIFLLSVGIILKMREEKEIDLISFQNERISEIKKLIESLKK